ncbi:ribonuclease HIII [Desulfurobacterium thermolithotrophum DSM 11699]|uniref:Ribonuclease n=1 Tax=Desulfurobacterium thermolithotrophum (strain DSM 11699 / BSA) TaxID=868864 RepID=F0S2K9_DESTD|nr:ribonuclease HIII [Desulfurobacterium thermolithotrophum]ADY73081.1 ribonuclease HIII [Desulfurobacterium thermolithotrophum DSM 11699]
MLDRENIELLVKKLKEKGAKEEKPPPHALYRLRKDKGILTIYKTGNVVFGGKDPSFLKEEVAKVYLQNVTVTTKVGCDEAGKGEFVGPLVVACVCADKNCLRKLLDLGVKDSKALSREKILKMAEEIKKYCRGRVKVIMPFQYNKLYEKYKNLNRLLEDIYVELIGSLLAKYSPQEVIVDKFSSRIEPLLKEKFKNTSFKVVPKAEKDLVVAAASIVAKAERLKAMEKLSKELGIELPEGNIQNEKVLKIVPEKLIDKFVKLHFKIKESK